MKKNSDAVAAWQREYDRWRQSLARIGYISQGSVLKRSVATSGRGGYQWTRKVAQKTVTVSLSFHIWRDPRGRNDLTRYRRRARGK